jgi:hypothetical protein
MMTRENIENWATLDEIWSSFDDAPRREEDKNEDLRGFDDGELSWWEFADENQPIVSRR